MKKLLFSLSLMLMTVCSANAQPPMHICSASGANNSFPFNTTTSNRVQNLFIPSDFIPTMPMGTITKIYYKSATSTTSTFSNVTISIGTTTLTGFVAGPWNTGLTTVFGPATYTNTFVNGQWFVFTLTTPFFYDGTSNIIVEASQTSLTSGVIIQQGGAGGNRRMWGNVTATTASAGTGLPEFGFDIIPGSPCTKAIATAATNINSTSATVNWNAVPGSFQYEYLIDTTTPGKVFKPIVATTATSAFVTGLIPNKIHYLRVRNYCSSISYSMWDTIQFMTLPPCNKIPKIAIAYVDSNNAQIQWDTANNIVNWRFLIDTNRADPANGNPLIQTTTNRFRSLTGLKEGKWYYVHVKSRCVQNDSSGWSLDSFYTPTPCRKPALTLSYIAPNTAVIYWSPVKTVVNYEYFAGNIADIPSYGGTPIITPTIQTAALKANTSYSLHVRCNCSDNGIKTSSGWSSIDYTTNPPLSVNAADATPSLSVYPNPVKETVFMNIGGNYKNDAVIELADITGKILHTTPVTGAQMQIDVRSYAAGVYMLRLKDNNTSLQTKFTKQ